MATVTLVASVASGRARRCPAHGCLGESAAAGHDAIDDAQRQRLLGEQHFAADRHAPHRLHRKRRTARRVPDQPGTTSIEFSGS